MSTGDLVYIAGRDRQGRARKREIRAQAMSIIRGKPHLFVDFYPCLGASWAAAIDGHSCHSGRPEIYRWITVQNFDLEKRGWCDD